MKSTKANFYAFIQALLRSYSQIFFSDSYWFAMPLILVSFLDVSAGLSGLISAVTANLAATLLRFDKLTITKGFYGFNSLLVGLGLGYSFELTLIIAVIAIISGFITLLVTVVFQGILLKYYLPYLSLPFVLCFWMIISLGWMLNSSVANQSGVYILNKLFSIGGYPLVNLHQWWVTNITSGFLNSYFLSLGAIFFQFNVFAGIVIAIALLFYSRIAFLLSLFGYSVAFSAYLFLGMDMTQLGYSHIGFNFILGAIAIGGYFYIPSKQSFLWAIAITPIIALTAAGLYGLLKPFNLTLLSLPFNVILLTFIYSLRFRTGENSFNEVIVQEGTPERNLYSFKSFNKRFPNFGYQQIKLPFIGEWYVNQGHNGELTHKGEWANAWDFVIINNEIKQFSNEGAYLKDYYCYGQNIIAPAKGVVVVVEDGIEDNRLGEVNTAKNWGNTVVIKHAEGLFSKLCHLQNGSIVVQAGDSVNCGQTIGKVGNSGRSPYPHLHFQLQATPYIGSKTLNYPLFAYVKNDIHLKSFDYPVDGDKIKPAQENPLLKKTFNFMPGAKMKWVVSTPKDTNLILWEVFTDYFNKSYIFCDRTKSYAYFQNDGIHFYFTHFKGDRKSLLYLFYLAAYRLPLVYIDGAISKDFLPVNKVFGGWRLFVHDFVSAFYMYLNSSFELSAIRNGSEFDLDSIEYNSKINAFSFKKLIWTKDIKLIVNKDNTLRLEVKHLKFIAICEAY